MSEWERDISEYINCTNNASSDSFYLRENGVKPNIIDLAGNQSKKTILDVGAGDGWVLNSLTPRNGYECDIVEPKDISKRENFSIQNIYSMKYKGNMFDTIIASLVLMWVKDIDSAFRELNRVTKFGGELIICITSPYFYRTGKASKGNTFTIDKDLTNGFIIKDLYIGGNVGPFTYYYHSLPNYLNSLKSSGWALEEIKDWSIDMNDYEKKVNIQRSKIDRTGIVPLYTFVKCKKIL